MSPTQTERNPKLMFAGMALVLAGLVFLAETFGVMPLRSPMIYGFFALLAGLGFLGAYRFLGSMKWAILPAILFLVIAVQQFIKSSRPGATFIPVIIVWGLAAGFLLVFKINEKRWWPIIPAGLLFFSGVGIGIDELGVFGKEMEPVIVLLGLSVTFMAVHLVARQKLWPLIVAGVLALIGFSQLVGKYALGMEFSPSFFLFGLGVVFLLIHFRRRDKWWPVIPGGVLCAVALTVPLDHLTGGAGALAPSLFLVGLSAVFGYLYLISNQVNRLAWARYPAIGLFFLGFFILVVEGGGSWIRTIILPLVLLAVGAVFIIRALRARSRR